MNMMTGSDKRIGIMKNTTYRFTKRDWLIAALLFLLVLFLCACRLKRGLFHWGDDHAAYINEGIAIAEGRFDEQTELNYFYHPTALPDEAQNGRLIYAWGYPLLMAVIYKVFGFDRIHFSTIIFYKIPSLLCLALTCSVLYLFYKRRLPASLAAGAAAIFCLNYDIIGFVNGLYSDLVFLFFQMLTLLLMECYAERADEEKPPYALAIVFGISLLMTYATRLNGPAACVIALLGHCFILWKRRGSGKQRLLRHALPYLIFLLLAILIEHFWLAPATGNASDIDGTRVWKLTLFYLKSIGEFFGQIYGQFYYVGYVLAMLSVLGFFTNGLRENAHLSLLLVGTWIVLILLPYHQGLRYLLNVLPLMIMYGFYGLLFVLKKLLPDTISVKKRKVFLLVLGILIVIYPLRSQTIASIHLLSDRDLIGEYDVYSPDAVETYRFIQAATPKDAVICFAKPRLLYLNTQRLSFRYNANGHRLDEADYYLVNKRTELESNLIEKTDVPMELVMENEGFALYSIQKDVSFDEMDHS